MTKYVIVLLIIFILIFLSLLRIQVPYEDKICICSNVSNKTSLHCPPGQLYRFAFGLEPNYVPSLTGILTIYQKETKVHTIEFDPNEMKLVNWLHHKGLDAYMLNSGPNSFSDLDSYLKRNQDYELVIDFKQKPPDNTTLWLCYLKSNKMFNF